MRITTVVVALLCSGAWPTGTWVGVSGTASDASTLPECASSSCWDDHDKRLHEASVNRMRRAVLELGDAAAPSAGADSRVSSFWGESQRALRNNLLHDDVRGFRQWRGVAGMFESAPMTVR